MDSEKKISANKATIVKCEVCQGNPFKYKCPRCEVQTCSLNCVKIHKKELECNGKRDSTTFVPVSKFSSLNLLSDYRFLENIDRAVNNCRRDPHRRCTRYDQPLPAHLYRLKAAANRRGIRLQYLPQHFTRHKSNKTKLDYATQEIAWKVDMIFPQGDMVKISETVSEKTRLSSLLNKYVDPLKCPEIYRNALKFYHAPGASSVLALLKAERSKKPNAVYVLDTDADISENLRNRVVIENPLMIIILNAYKDEFFILEDDEGLPEDDDCGGKKYGFFGDFNPVKFFDKLENSPGQKDGNEALNSIRSSVRELLKNDEDSDSDAIRLPSQSDKKTRQQVIHIPRYDQI